MTNNSNVDLKLLEKEQWGLLIRTIADQKNAFTIDDMNWGNCGKMILWPDDSFKGECGTPACVLGWAHSLELNICIPEEIYMPHPNNSNARFHYNQDPKWFTRKKTVMMLKHYVETIDWETLDEHFEGIVDWRLDEKGKSDGKRLS